MQKININKTRPIIVNNSNPDINNQQNYNKITDNFILNETENKIIINGKIYEFSEIISAELKEDEVGSNVISGIGNSHNSYNTLYGIGINKKMISRLTLEIKTNNINNPFISISFLKTKIRIGYDKNSKKYNEAYQKAQHCLSVLELIIKDNNKNNVEI